MNIDNGLGPYVYEERVRLRAGALRGRAPVEGESGARVWSEGRAMKVPRLPPFAFVLVCAALLVTCASGGALYKDLGLPDDAVPFWGEARSGRLEGGMTYFILENAKPENRVRLTLAVKAGSVHEEEDERGLAHFVEHMAFNGTERFPELQLLEYLRSLGMRFGADANAYTSFTKTVYSIEAPVEIVHDTIGDIEGGTTGTSRKAVPEKALAIIDDWSRAVLFAEKDVDEERRVIMEEYRARLGVGDRVQQQVLPVLFRDSRYKDRRPIGLPEVIENAGASRLKGFYDKWYRPENMAVIIVGDIDGAALEETVRTVFARQGGQDNESGGFTRPVYELAPPEQGRFEAKVITDDEYGPANVSVYVKRDRKAKAATLAGYREELIESLAFQILNTRFAEQQDDPASPFTRAGGGPARYDETSRFVVFSGTAKQGRARDALRAVLTEKERAARYGFTASEIDRAKTDFLGYLEQYAAEQDKIESAVFEDEIITYYLEGGYLAGIAWEADAIRTLLPGITARDLKNAFNAMLAFDDTTVFVIANEHERATLPDEPEIASIVSEVKKARIARPADRKQSGVLLATAPRPGAILSESLDEAAGAVRLTLSNGAQVILKPTSNKNDEIVLSALARGGYTGVPLEHRIPARLAADLFEVSGAGPYSVTDLAQLLAGKNVAVGLSIGPFTRNISGRSSVKDLKTFFEMLYLAWTEPRIDEKAVNAYLDRLKTYIRQNRDNPDAYFQNELTRALYAGNPYFMPLEEEDVAQVSLDIARDFLIACRNPADWTFVFTGNIDLASFRAYLTAYLAAIPQGAGNMNTYGGETVTRPAPGITTIRKGKEDRSTVFLGYFAKVPFEAPFEAPFNEKDAMAASMLNEYLDIHLNDVIREERGGVYSMSIQANLSPLPPGELTLETAFYCDPSRAGELQAAIGAELDKIARGVISADIFAKAQEAQVKAWETSMQDNGYLAARYASYAVIFGIPLSRLHERDETLRSITPGDIQAAAQKLTGAGPDARADARAFVFVMNPE